MGEIWRYPTSLKFNCKAPARPQIGANAAVGSKAEELTAGTTCWELTIQQTLRLGGSGPIAPFWPCADRI